MTRNSLLPLLALCLAFPTAAARAQEDVEGSKDHPAVKRYPGSTIYSDYAEKEFEGADFPVGPARCEHVEGKYFTALYLYPPKVSCTQVLRNYENAFKAARLTLYSGKDVPAACNTWEINGSSVQSWATATGKGPKGGKTWIFVGCAGNAYDQPAGLVRVVEAQAMEQKVEVDADYLAGEIEKTGRVSVYGINFATGKADITPDSAKVLDEIGSLLARRPDWRLRVEGHTDNVGSAKSNQELSDRRAQSVKAWLTSKNGVKPARLETAGLGDTRPVADNATEAGRAKNRRVELVKL